jgi:putative glutamine amidotransferase
VGVISDHRMLDGTSWHLVEEHYLNALVDVAVVPVAVPSLGARIDLMSLLSGLDGVVLTGSRSDLEPRWYGEEAARAVTESDPRRDATALKLGRLALVRGLPLLAICRGFQELNVALGGTLYQDLDDAGFNGHRDTSGAALEARYAPRHPIEIAAGSRLHEISGLRRAVVNSLHHQGIKQLAARADPVAHAPDGLIEAFTVPQTAAFNLAVQFHPEWRPADDPLSRAIFSAFASACTASQAVRGTGAHGDT